MTVTHGEEPRPADDDVPDVGEAEARAIGADLRLGPALADPSGGTHGDHLGLAELEALASVRGRDASGDALPRHLTSCPVCLDLYEALLEGVPALAPESLARHERLFDAPTAASARPTRWSGRMGLLSAAACLAILVVAGLQTRHLVAPNPPRSAGGSCRLADGAVLAPGLPIPARRQVVVEAGTALNLDDGGTSVRAERESNLSFSRSLAGHPVFHVHDGDVRVTAARQRPGMAIHVRTALGDIRVVGTEFRVTVGSEPIVIHEVNPADPRAAAYEGRVATVTVTVTEGSVAVSTTHDRTLLTAGQSALLRQGQPHIEVR